MTFHLLEPDSFKSIAHIECDTIEEAQEQLILLHPNASINDVWSEADIQTELAISAMEAL